MAPNKNQKSSNSHVSGGSSSFQESTVYIVNTNMFKYAYDKYIQLALVEVFSLTLNSVCAGSSIYVHFAWRSNYHLILS